ncbi:UBP-type zinc finger domain-containing protein [Cupriavidus sp. 2TAF22]|uniref:UBP-type zinc finger domain-containing protein n=1 Tax=unclassified Cupriavidus TaxID=2640874 RepID=UPI003F928CA1
MTTVCPHLALSHSVTPSSNGCEECLRSGDEWVHLRICLCCGHVGCCDDSPNQHASRHFLATQHPVVRSFEPGESWRWCYIDKLFIP